MKIGISQLKLRTLGTLSITSVVLFIVTMIVASLLKNVLPQYHSKQFWILNLIKLIVCIILTTLVGYSVRQIPSMLTLNFLKTDDFNPKDVKEAKGTILVAPAFMFILGSTFTKYLALFQTYNEKEKTEQTKKNIKLHTACGRSASEDDIRCYLAKNIDLKNAFCPSFPSCSSQQLEEALCHYANSGIKEGRYFGC